MDITTNITTIPTDPDNVVSLPTANVLRLPSRRERAIWLSRDDDGAWLILAHGHGWLHGSSAAADAEAAWLAGNLGDLPIRSIESSN
jgi:hypothetical protein